MKRHLRHIGHGLIALFKGDEQIREIGITPGWDFKDRDEIITRYNEMQDPEGSQILLKKSYDGESIYDASRDFGEAFDGNFTPEVKLIPTDEYGIQKGKFQVIVKWIPEENSNGSGSTIPE